MAILPILKYPDPLLQEVSEPVEKFDAELSRLVDSMFETMYVNEGIGLAAPQIGVLKRITVVDVNADGTDKREFINPEIIETVGTISYEEGCLSIPGYREKVTRAAEVRVKAFDRHGTEFELSADDILAICLQHEIDHLDGVLFVERLSPLKKQLFRSWFKKRAPLE